MTLPNRCTRCQKRLNQQSIRLKGMQFHPECFICDACKKPIQRNYVPKGQRIYDPECYDKLFALKCAHCKKTITGKYMIEGKSRFHEACFQDINQLFCCVCETPISGSYRYDHWGNKAHPEHQGEPITQCHVCARIISEKGTQGGVTLQDGRRTCGLCDATRLKTDQERHQAKLEVLAQMKAVGFDYIPDYIRAQVAEDQSLVNQRLKASPTGNIHGYTKTAQRNIPNYGLILEHSIFIISGLPKVAFMSVLAHELLHVWIHEKNLRHLSPPEVEGFCNLASALIFQNEGSELAEVMLKRMDEDPDPTYGDGYRLMKRHLAQMGWPKLIAAMQDTAGLPELTPAVDAAEPLASPTQGPSRPSKPAAKSPSSESPQTRPQKRTFDPEASQKLEEIKARLNKTIQGSKTSKPGSSSKSSGGNSKLKKLGKKKKK